MAEVLPVALMVGGTLVSAMGQAQAGQSQQAGYQYEAASARQAAGEATAAGSSASMEQARKTAIVQSNATASAAASGTNPGFGSALTNTGRIAKWGTYNGLMAMYDSQVQATGLKNQAGADEFSGQEAAQAGQTKAIGTLISGADTLYGKYG